MTHTPETPDGGMNETSRSGNRLAAFESVATLRSAYDAAVAEGVDSSRLEVLSNVPIEGLGGPKSRVLAYALGGALAGGLTVFLLASESAKAYPLITGGMPIVAGPAVGLVTYEGTALGAILATVLGVLWEGRIFRRSRQGDQDLAVQDLLAQGLHVLTVTADGGDLELPRAALEGSCSIDALDVGADAESG